MMNQAEDRMRLRRVLPERAIALAMENRWSEAADVNRKIIELYPNDADAYNRLGKALLEMGRYRDALATYQRAVELDPNNMIAKKNVERLAHLADKATEPTRIQPAAQAKPAEAARINPTMFIEETGKTGVTTLVNLGPPELLIEVTAGDNIDLKVNGTKLEVYDEDGQYVGQVEPKLAKRLIGLIETGNRYTAAVTTVGDKAISIIIRETYQHPSNRGKFSFPPKALPTGAYRPYMREGALRGMEEDEDSMFDFEGDDTDQDGDDHDEEDYEEDDNDEEEEV
jgi:tetratricopeptide (TPR) repeat protein